MTKRKARTSEQKIVRVPCYVEGHENDWIEYDASSWGLHTFRRVHRSDIADGLREWVEVDSVDWHLTGENGAVQHPGWGAEVAVWESVYEQLGSEGLVLVRWLGSSPLFALDELMTVDKKSDDGGPLNGSRGEADAEST